MISQEVIDEILQNILEIEEIKIEDCAIYNEYSVIVLYKEGSDIIECENSEEANSLFDFLTIKLNQYKEINNKEDCLFDEVKTANLNNITDKKDGKISGNYRLQAGMYRTPKQQETYIEESLERELP